MDSCLLCLEFNKELLNFIETNSTRWQELNITEVLEKHFWPLNTMQPSTWMCLSCWQKLDDFNKFYLSIEEAHFNLGKIKVEENLVLSKEEISSQESENFSYCCLEPEILMDQNELGDKESTLKRNTKKRSLGENIILKKDPLAKVTKPRNIKKIKTMTSPETNTAIQNAKDAQIKPEPDDFSNSDCSDSMNDDEDSDDEPSTNSSESVKNRIINKREDDEFITEHFKHMCCDLCDVPFENFSDMPKHFSTVHDRKGYLVCCTRKFYQRNHLVDHLHCHLNPDHFKCAQCGKVLSDRKNFKSHMLRVHRPNDVVLKHSCDICGKSFIQGYLLRTHKLTHLPKEEKKFPCTECGKFYGNSYLLKIHTEVVHLKKQAKVCYICGKTLGTSTEYKAHMNKHEGIPAPLINCDVCGLRLISERSLKLHKESQHPVGGKQQHPCPVCHKISPTARALKKHVITMHEKGYDHKCSMCEKAFKRAEALRDHMASHTGSTLYTCPWCPKMFNSNGNMHAHRKKVHPKEWEEAKLQKYSGNLPVELRVTIANNNIEEKC
ncbi:transcription factor grauzone-like [Calliphora vicina]|uniref:transcription factor grauzone-like n=1 Tax=Calliphora vicina TaxID=7373 RepID=UPI00325C1678